MRFFKENSYDITKLFINQMGITIFALVLYTAIGFIDDATLNLRVKIILSVFSTIFYFALLYTATWDFGAKDRIRIDSGKYSATKLKGFLMSIIASIPTFVLAAVCCVTMIIHLSSGSEAAYSVFAVFNLLLRFISAMFLGLLQGVFSALSHNPDLKFLLESIGYLVMPIFTALICHVGYVFGRREFKIISLFSSKTKK